MNKLSNQAINEFIDIYLKEYGVRLNRENAEKLAIELLEFFKLIYRPIPKTETT